MFRNLRGFTFPIFVLILISNVHGDVENHAQKLKQESVKVSENIPYSSPVIKSNSIYIAEHFDNFQEFKRKWILSKAKKPDVSEDIAQFDGKWELAALERFPLSGDTGLLLASERRHAAIISKFNKPFVFDNKRKFVIQYVITFQKTVDCGGAYLKLLTDGALKDLTLFNDKTPYTIMFGPDKCGGIPKMHFIIRHKNPKNGTIVEKHCTKLKVDDNVYKDLEPHLFKLVIEPDNNFAFYLDDSLQYKGNLLDEDTFNPPINPPKEIVDETDVKPADWDDRPKIADPNAVKPDDWDEDEPAEIPDPNAVKPEGWLDDEPLTVPDENAVKPADWDEEMDGEWEPPMVENQICKEAAGCGPWSPAMIENPKFKGKWKPQMIDNPNYKGKWVPKKIPNPDYFFDDAPLKHSPIGYVGFELWSLVNNVYFDDILVTDNEAISNEWTSKTWSLKKQSIAAESASFYKMFVDYTNNYPWLWAVYVLILAVIVGFIGSCCLRLRRNKDDFEKETLVKKTDEYQPDDETNQILEQTLGENEESDAGNADTKISGDTDAGNEYNEDTDPDEKNSKPSSEEEPEEEETEKENIPSKPSRKPKPGKKLEEKSEEKDSDTSSSPRKRRPRRD